MCQLSGRKKGIHPVFTAGEKLIVRFKVTEKNHRHVQSNNIQILHDTKCLVSLFSDYFIKYHPFSINVSNTSQVKMEFALSQLSY